MKRTKGERRTGPSERKNKTQGIGKGPGGDAEVRLPTQRRELGILISAWFILAIIITLLAKQSLSAPGLNYDEAIFGGMDKDFLTGRVHGPHFPGSESVEIFGRPFPLFIQPYLGALKCWLWIPCFSLFGFSVAVLRSANLFCGIVALLFLMLGTWRWLGLRTALIAGLLLAFDPAYFFLCVWDWGGASSSFMCRCMALCLAVSWWQRRQAPYAFLAGLFAGLAFFNKVDFAVTLIAVALAGLICFGRLLLAQLTSSISSVAFAAAGFLLGASLMLFKLPLIVGSTVSRGNPRAVSELGEKLHTMLALYDGSYFYRLMSVGGVFEKMYSEPMNWLPLLGSGVVVAGIVCVVTSIRNPSGALAPRIGLFFLLSIVLITFGVILLPGATRIYHAVLVYPLPHMLIGLAVNISLERLSASRRRGAMHVAIWIALLALLLGQVRAIYKAQAVVRESGGRGRWSERFEAFCREHRNRSDLTIVSLDWGFNEQLNFLTEAPRLTEPFWTFGQNGLSLRAEPNSLYLVYPPDYSVYPFGTQLLGDAQMSGSEVEVRPYFDRQNRVEFYTIQFPRR